MGGHKPGFDWHPLIWVLACFVPADSLPRRRAEHADQPDNALIGRWRQSLTFRTAFAIVAASAVMPGITVADLGSQWAVVAALRVGGSALIRLVLPFRNRRDAQHAGAG